MKRLFIYFVLFVFVLTGIAAQQASPQSAVAELSFSYTRLSGAASNQFAVWVEDAQGQYVKTLYVTRWTANGGWSRRPASIPEWVKKSALSQMSKAQIDAVSGATPRTGNLTYAWDGTDSRGAPVSNGDYVIVLEGTLRWENQVYYRAPIKLGSGSAVVEVSVLYVGDADADRAMIGSVTARTLR